MNQFLLLIRERERESERKRGIKIDRAMKRERKNKMSTVILETDGTE